MFKCSIKASKMSNAKDGRAAAVTAATGGSFLNGMNRLNPNVKYNTF